MGVLDLEELTRGALDARISGSAKLRASLAGEGLVPVHGTFDLDLAAHGSLLPGVDLSIAGDVDGKRIGVREWTARSLSLAVDARNLPSRPRGDVKVVARDVAREPIFLRELSIVAANRENGKIDVSVRSRPRQAPWLFEADAVVAGLGRGERVVVDMLRHRVRAGNGANWRGGGGSIAISASKVVVRDVSTASRDGRLSLAGTYRYAGRRAGNFDASLEMRSFALDNISSLCRGVADVELNVRRRGDRVTGSAAIDGTGLAWDPDHATFDVRGRLELNRDELRVSARSSSELGVATLALVIDPPADITDPTAWRALDRAELGSANLTLASVDLAGVARLAGLDGYAGRLDGRLQISADHLEGFLRTRKLQTPSLDLRDVATDVCFTQVADDRVSVIANAMIDRTGRIAARATIELPESLLDMAAWRGMGAAHVAASSVRARDLAIDRSLLARLGVRTDLRAHIDVAADLGDGLTSGTVEVTARRLRGGAIARPIDVVMTSELGERIQITATVGTDTAKLADLNARIAIGLEELTSNPAAILDAPLDARVALRNTPARAISAVFGETVVRDGQLTGSIDLAGTINDPMLAARITGTAIEVAPGVTSPRIAPLDRVIVDARWDGTEGRLAVDGMQRHGVFHLVASGRPDALQEAELVVEARNFDLDSLLAFAPGPAGAVRGKLDAKLAIEGLDPRTSKVSGQLHLSNARIPIAPSVGTLRRAQLTILVTDKGLDVRVDGRLGGGRVHGEGSIAMSGARPTGGKVTLRLRDVEPIGLRRPIVDADVTTALRREGAKWIADVAVRNASVVLRDDGDELDPIGAPPDMVFVGAPTRRAERGRPSREDTVADRAVAYFDGSIDPRLDIQISHDFAEVTTITRVRGRLSNPELVLSSSPATYSEGQLLGILLGGSPGGELGAGQMEAIATSAGASFLTKKITGYLEAALPIDLDVLRYEPAVGEESAKWTVGTWLSRSLFVAYRGRADPKPLQNQAEVEVE